MKIIAIVKKKYIYRSIPLDEFKKTCDDDNGKNYRGHGDGNRSDTRLHEPDDDGKTYIISQSVNFFTAGVKVI
jgi:hypothetical protein